MKPYPIQLEISGPTALWTRPDTGSSPVSYVAPTFSAVKGIFESVLRWKSVNVRPTKVEICAPVQFHRYTANYGGPLRASDAMNKGASYSLARRTGEGGRRPGEGRRWHDERICSTSAAPDYVDPPAEPKPPPGGTARFRHKTRVCEAENHELPSMLRMVFDPTAIFSQN